MPIVVPTMKTQSLFGISVIVILIIAIAAVVGFTVLPRSSNTAISAKSTASSTSQATTSSEYSTTSTSSTGTPTSSQQKTGELPMGVTDPPVAASGVSDAQVKYNGVAVHRAGSPSDSGWVDINASGTIDLTSSANVSQTVAEEEVQSGTYDMARINITSGMVVYNNEKYAAAISSGSINATMQQEAQVNSSQASEAIIDLRTFIINSGNSSSPQFIISATAKATAEPPSAITSASLQVGARTSLQGQAWWTAFVDQTSTRVIISSATLTNGSLDFDLKNTGNSTADVQTVIITPLSATAIANASLPSSLAGSAVFTLSSTGSMQESNTLQGVALLTSVGTQVGASSSTTVSYTGNVALGFGLTGILQIDGVVSGQQYLITCMGANTYSSIVVVAQ